MRCAGAAAMHYYYPADNNFIPISHHLPSSSYSPSHSSLPCWVVYCNFPHHRRWLSCLTIRYYTYERRFNRPVRVLGLHVVSSSSALLLWLALKEGLSPVRSVVGVHIIIITARCCCGECRRISLAATFLDGIVPTVHQIPCLPAVPSSARQLVFRVGHRLSFFLHLCVRYSLYKESKVIALLSAKAKVIVTREQNIFGLCNGWRSVTRRRHWQKQSKIYSQGPIQSPFLADQSQSGLNKSDLSPPPPHDSWVSLTWTVNS